MGKPALSQTDYLQAVIKAYQYLAGLISDREVWVELEKLLTHYFQADLVAFLGRRPSGEIVLHHCSLADLDAGSRLLQEISPMVAEVLESGFLAAELLDLPQSYAVAFLPVSERKQTTRVMVVGHRQVEPLDRPLLDIYLALAGLCGTTLERLSAERRVQRMTEKVPVMLFELLVHPDGDLEFSYVSRQAGAIFCQSPDALLDNPRSFLETLHPTERQEFMEALTTAGTEGIHLSREIRCGDSPVSERYLLCHALSSLQEGGIVVWDGAFMDITERKRAEEEVRMLNAELEQRVRERTAQLEEANKELEGFAYSVSHDLRAPLRAIHGYSQIVLKECGPNLDSEGQRFLKIILDSAVKMDTLINDLLAFSRLGRHALKVSVVDMDALVTSVIAELQDGLPLRRSWKWKLHPLPPAQADESLLRQVWINLLANALKFTRLRENALVEVGCRQETEEIIYYVKDNGAGFDKRYVDKLFNVFQRLHREEEFEGTGIGLAIVQRIISRHGGRVWAEGKVKAGATFYFSLPLNKCIMLP